MSEATKWTLSALLGMMVGVSLVLLLKDYPEFKGDWTPKVAGVIGLVMSGVVLYEMIRGGVLRP